MRLYRFGSCLALRLFCEWGGRGGIGASGAVPSCAVVNFVCTRFLVEILRQGIRCVQGAAVGRGPVLVGLFSRFVVG